MDLVARAGVWLRDVGLVVPLLFVGLAGTRPAGENQVDWSKTPDALAYVCVILAASSLVARRRWPAWMLALCGASIALYLLIGYPFGPILLSAPFAAYAVGSRWTPRRTAVGATAFYVATLAASLGRFVDAPAEWASGLAWAIAWAAVIAAPAAVGVVVGVRREAAEGVRAEQARRAVSEERLRMSADLHDVVGHGLAVIAMQSGVALHVLDRSPDKARESLEAIVVIAREALDGLRDELDQLREPDGAARRPLPGLADVGGLVGRVRAGGVDVELRFDEHELSDVDPAVGAATYRIVQESLTNVLRHAGPARARVGIRRDDGVVVVEVTDDGAGSPGTDALAGSGIRGMRERAETLGGRLEAGPRAGGGFAVTARIPTVERSAS
ncbi:MAG TPA: sensor histidine kinase [Actinomycetales bacterium]|nr:sensor histidine kinase [Actinomycetales bacterium]